MYKRQVLERADVRGCFDGDTLISQFAVYPLKMNIYGVVSYTHLDVYKRQILCYVWMVVFMDNYVLAPYQWSNEAFSRRMQKSDAV